MDARIHRRELIVPATFAEGVRRGDISIGGGKGSGSGTTEVYNVTINVEGSVLAEGKLVDTVITGIQTKRKRGALPAGVTV